MCPVISQWKLLKNNHLSAKIAKQTLTSLENKYHSRYLLKELKEIEF